MTIEQAINSIALSKLSADADARGMLTPGQYNVDTTVHVKGTIKVGADYDVAPTVSIPLKETLALFIAYSGVTRDNAIKALRKAMQDSIDKTGKGQGALIANIPVVDETMETVQSEIIQQLPRQPRKGSVTTKLTVEELVTA